MTLGQKKTLRFGTVRLEWKTGFIRATTLSIHSILSDPALARTRTHRNYNWNYRGPRWRILMYQELVKKKTLHFLEVNKHREYDTRIVFEGVLCIRTFLALTCLSRL